MADYRPLVLWDPIKDLKGDNLWNICAAFNFILRFLQEL